MIPSPALVPSPSPTQLPAAGGLVGPVIRQAGEKAYIQIKIYLSNIF